MAHLCPTCSETCYCMADFTETLSVQPAYCKHCTEYKSNEWGDSTDKYDCLYEDYNE